MDFCPCKAAAEVCNSQVPPFGAAVIFCRGDLHGNDQTIARPPWDVQIAPRNPEAWPIVLRDRPLVERFKAVPGRNVRVLPDFAPLGAEARAVGELFDFQSYHLLQTIDHARRPNGSSSNTPQHTGPDGHAPPGRSLQRLDGHGQGHGISGGGARIHILLDRQAAPGVGFGSGLLAEGLELGDCVSSAHHRHLLASMPKSAGARYPGCGVRGPPRCKG